MNKKELLELLKPLNDTDEINIMYKDEYDVKINDIDRLNKCIHRNTNEVRYFLGEVDLEAGCYHDDFYLEEFILNKNFAEDLQRQFEEKFSDKNWKISFVTAYNMMPGFIINTLMKMRSRVMAEIVSCYITYDPTTKKFIINNDGGWYIKNISKNISTYDTWEEVMNVLEKERSEKCKSLINDIKTHIINE
jgi:hypothetical protein